MNLVHQILVVSFLAVMVASSSAAPRDQTGKELDCPQEKDAPDDGTDPTWGDLICDFNEITYDIANFTWTINNTEGEYFVYPFAVYMIGNTLGGVAVTNLAEDRAFISDILLVDYGNNTGFANVTMEIDAGKLVEVFVVYHGVEEEGDAQIIPFESDFIV